MATIIQTVRIEQNDSVWLFALISLLIVFEGSYTIIMRAGDERKWFCTSLLLYIVATAPPIWLLETKLCEWREDLAKDGKSDILIDIVEFFDVFKEKVVYTDKRMQQIVLAAWTLSLLQFPFVLTVSRARKMRVAITKAYEELIMPRRRAEFWQVIRDVDIWAIILANSLQDIPFLLVRLYLMLIQGLVTYTMIFFTFKNALIIFFQTYRAFIIVNDRYIHPRPPEIDIYDNPHNRTNSRRHHSRKSPHSKSRKGIRGGGMKDDERQHLVANNSPRRNSQNSASTR
ncbi:hypothetical protein WR25_16890 isoform A [Diploscapter pachys]|uniref:Uncharacterized protein n=1 Tax=Diploscapter pachys TaxID=2018661 RepID=A0A2A2LE27_9BILA|nr:hypothetical protein WR25_16890 isoform A [Diploscapter pachys]